MTCLRLVVSLGLVTCASVAFAQEGIERHASQYPVEETRERLLGELDGRGISVFSEIDHSANARTVDLALDNTLLVLFGNPAVGTLLMQCEPMVALELPLKALIHEDEVGNVWLSWQSPLYLAQRYGLDAACDETVAQMTALLEGMMASVAGAE